MNMLANAIDRVMDTLFGCRHQDVSRPFTLRRRTYKVCLECGRELRYSLRTMSYVSDRAAAAPQVRQPATVLAFQPRPLAADGDVRNTSVAA